MEESERCAMEELPFEILIGLSEYSEPKELLTGLASTNRQFRALFADESYWEDRVRRSSKNYHAAVLDLNCNGDGNFWKKRSHRWEYIHKKFKWNRLTENLLGEEDQQFLGNFRALDFVAGGRCLAYVAKDRHCISVWVLGDDTASKQAPPHLLTYEDHDQRVMSLRTQGEKISSGAFDGAIYIRDLDHLTGPPIQKLCSTGFVMAHTWKDHSIVSTTRGGAVELFDTRADEDPQMREKLFSPTEVCNDIKVQFKESPQVLLAGWDNGVRKLKLFDLRSQEVVAETEAATWNLSMHYGDERLFVGADKGRVMEYNATTLDLVADYSASFGHLANAGWLPDVAFLECVRSIIYSDGHVFTADLRQVKAHDLGRKPQLLWDQEIVFSELAFCPERCMLAAAVGHTPDQIKLYRPTEPSKTDPCDPSP